MFDYLDLYRHVRKVFDTYWTATPFAFENQPVPGEDEVDEGTSAAYPAALVLVEFDYEPEDWSSFTDSQISGSVKATILVQADSGEDRLHDLFDQLRSIFVDHGDSEENVQFLEPHLGESVMTEDLAQFGREAVFPFTRFQSRS